MSSKIEETILLDYLSFTVKYSGKMLERIYNAFDVEDETLNGFGGMGYTESVFVLDGGRVFWHPDRPEMGIHVRLNSASVAQSGFTAFGLIGRVLDMEAKIKRIDIALDDFEGLLDLDEVYKNLRDGDVVTRFRRVGRIESSKLGEIEGSGLTVSLGSRSSEAFIRMYDKKAEQEGKTGKRVGVDHWVRVEMELKSDKAHAFGVLLFNSVLDDAEGTSGDLCSNLLYGLLDFKTPVDGDTNKSRWPTSPWWQEFVNTKKKLTLSIPKDEKTLDDTKRWMQNQVSTSLAMIVLSLPDDDNVSGYDFVINCIVNGGKSMSKLQRDRLNVYNEQQREKMRQTILPI